MNGCAHFADGEDEALGVLFSPSEKEERRNPFMNLAQYLTFHGGFLGVPFSFSLSHSHELTAQSVMPPPP